MTKDLVFGSDRCNSESDSDGEDSREQSIRDTKDTEEGLKKGKTSVWLRPKCDQVKMIDFGGATAEDEYHTAIINTR